MSKSVGHAPAHPPRRVLVTGASSGIGRAVALHLLARGYDVYGTSRNPERLVDVEGLHPVALDLTDRASIGDAARAVLDQGGVDILVNNAGAGWVGPLEHCDEDTLQAQFQVLFFGPSQLTRALLPDLRRRRGMVINITSLGGQIPVPFMGPYSAAKVALSTLTDVWQLEVPEDEVAFVDIQPGDLRTAFNDDLDPDRWGDDERYGGALGRAFAVNDANVQSGPGPEVVARAVERFIVRGRHGRAQVGDTFQSVIGTLVTRLIPRSRLLAVLRSYYKLR